MQDTDRIERRVSLRATRTRVWRALTDASEFGTWFCVKLEGAFAPGQTTSGRILHPGHERLRLVMRVERIEPERLFSFRWHPYAIDPDADYSHEATTLVEFRLEDDAMGTMLTVIESGFDQLPPERRDLAFRMNDGGWAAQLLNVKRHVEA